MHTAIIIQSPDYTHTVVRIEDIAGDHDMARIPRSAQLTGDIYTMCMGLRREERFGTI